MIPCSQLLTPLKLSPGEAGGNYFLGCFEKVTLPTLQEQRLGDYHTTAHSLLVKRGGTVSANVPLELRQVEHTQLHNWMIYDYYY